MRRTLALIPLLILILFCSCVSGTNINEKNPDGSPVWTKEIPTSNKLLYGVGKAKMLIDSNSQQAADAAARSDLAMKISVNIKNALSIYSQEASAVVVSAYETIIVQSVNLTMKEVVVEQRWTDVDGTVWSLVSFRIKNLPQLYSDAANDYLNQLEEKKISTQQKLTSLLEELLESNDNDALELKSLAQKKADSIIAEVEEISRGIDIDAQSHQIEKYLTENGFDMNDKL